jgi:WD40 repeat protein
VSSNGAFVASAGMDRSVKLWTNTLTKVSEIKQAHLRYVTALCFTPDGRYLASGGADSLVRIWDVNTLKPVHGPFVGHTGDVEDIEFSPDGKYMFTSSEDKTVRIWDVGEAKLLYTLVAFQDGGYVIFVSGALHMSRFKDPIYFLTKPIQWMPNKEQDLPQVKVPKGFVTDLASIPQVFWSLLRPDGEYTYPAIINDYLYWTQTIPKEKADLIFRLAMEDFNINTTTALIIYNAVSSGGGSAWRSNTDQRARGEMRFLKRFPEDPRVTWAEWKEEPDVFDAELR